MSFDKIIIIIMAVFAILGGLDRIFGNRLKLGEAFENGIKTMGELALSMIGIIVLAPIIAKVLAPVVAPVFGWLGADPSAFAGILLACDMGGAPLAEELAKNPEAAHLSGLITASMLGATISFTIPVAMNTLKGEDRTFGAKGILCGVVTIPFGILLGGLTAGYELLMVLKNTLPIVVVSLLIALGLWKWERGLIKGFVWFGRLITAVATIGLAAGGVELITGFCIIPGLGSMQEAFAVVGQIAIVLAGAFPLIAVLQKILKYPIAWVGRKMKINEISVSGLIATLANSIATFDMVKGMDERGKVVNMAFAVSGAFVFGDHLAFTAGYEPSMIAGVVVGKLAAGITAIALALLITKKKERC
ncbi:MAG: ethanolamine utilization protein EutH [Clostridia bacterium]|nr:ethanolamine utilization protein EutH [Clostridia bacterium]